jgi:cell division protein FtsI (penicillin-binding protein 3)
MAVSIKQDLLNRVRNVFIASILLAIAVVYRLVYVQVKQGEYWKNKIEKNSIKALEIPAERGNIYSDNGSLLATSVPEFRIDFDPNVADNSSNNAKMFRKNINEICNQLGTIFTDKSAAYFHKQIMNARHWHQPDTTLSQLQRAKLDKNYKVIKIGNRAITFEEKEKLEQIKLIKQGKYKSGFVFTASSVRSHPFGNMGYRTIGVLPSGKVPGRGLEASMNNYLAGLPGRGIFEILKGGSKKAVADSPEARPIPGMDVYTTIDVNIQDEAETALRKAVEEYQPNYASAIVMEVQSGEIKAMANLGYDPTTKSYFERVNYALAESTTPGSTFKLPSMLALLEEGVKPTDIVETGDGKITFRGKELTDSKRGGFGTLTVQQVFEKSSNIGIMKLVMNTFGGNEQKYYDYLAKFKLREKIGFQMIGEPEPIFYAPGNKYHSDFSLPWTAFGGIESKLTPLQMLTMYNAVANNGYWVEPIIVKHVKRANQIVHNLAAEQRRLTEPIASKASIETVKKMMEGVVERGTAASQRSSQYKFAGKTGTSRKLKNGSFQKGLFYTAFAGYFPANDPKYSIIVVIDEPKGKDSEQLYAADVAAPVFRQIADHIYADDLQIKALPTPSQANSSSNTSHAVLLADKPILEKNHPTPQAITTKNISINANIKPSKTIVPNVVGLSLRDALYVLENKNFKVHYTGLGKVTSQNIVPGSMASKGTVVELLSH